MPTLLEEELDRARTELRLLKANYAGEVQRHNQLMISSTNEEKSFRDETTRLVGLARRQLLREAALLDALLVIAAEPTRYVHARANGAIANHQAQVRRDVEAFGDLPPVAAP